jgi:hypothetical protein
MGFKRDFHLSRPAAPHKFQVIVDIVVGPVIGDITVCECTVG